jgi:hypothetical protein
MRLFPGLDAQGGGMRRSAQVAISWPLARLSLARMLRTWVST